MDRLQKIKAYSIENFHYDRSPGAEEETARLFEQISEVLHTYNPEVICMAGIARGDLMLKIAEKSDAFLVLVEHSMKVIEEFRKMHEGNPLLEKIYFIQGDFNNFPVDYYAANLLISIDNINYLESGLVIDEFRRALDFDGILFVATCLTCEDDTEGKLDEVVRAAFPLHNEYYMSDELKTVMDLNEFKFIKGHEGTVAYDITERADFFSRVFDTDPGAVTSIIEENSEVLAQCYGMAEGKFTVPYYSGIFMRIKPEYLKRDMAGQL